MPELTENVAARASSRSRTGSRPGRCTCPTTRLNRYIDEAQGWINDNTECADQRRPLHRDHPRRGADRHLFLILFATFFFLRDGRGSGGSSWSGCCRSPPGWRVDDAGSASWNTLVAYVRATVLVAFIDAVGIGIFLVIFDVPFAFPLAALVFLGAFIPIVGAALSGVVAVLVALVDQRPRSPR